jgi:N-formylglutamate deformylase
MKLPLLISVPHGGSRIAPEVEEFCRLTLEDIIADGDEGSEEIYSQLADHVEAFISFDIARAILDVNRPEDDRSADGVVKTETIWKVSVYREFPPEETIQALLARYYRPYHASLTQLAGSGAILGVDCHTMAATAPPIEPNAGQERPLVCISDANGTCPARWRDSLVQCFEDAFEHDISVNDPFRGGYIIRRHAVELPWVQVELSRSQAMRANDKGKCVLAALQAWCARASI